MKQAIKKKIFILSLTKFFLFLKKENIKENTMNIKEIGRADGNRNIPI